MNKTRTTPLHMQSDDMVERYIKTVKEYLRKVVASHQRNWDTRLPTFFLAYRASAHDSTGLIPTNLMFGRELRLPYDPLFTPTDREWPTIDHENSPGGPTTTSTATPTNI
jgi:hypothetical protein